MSQPKPGKPFEVATGIRCILANNPGPMTHWGTNSFIIGENELAIVDPGPNDERHLQALLAAVGKKNVAYVLITHPHKDHSPMAKTLAHATGAPILGFGPPQAGRSATMQKLASSELVGGGEGVDMDFLPDRSIVDGEFLDLDGHKIGVHHTPGHFAGQLAFSLENTLISGDHVMDWSSSLISPPDGDLGAFMRTSEKLKHMPIEKFLPSHGGAIDDPAARLNWLINHRKTRETSILDALNAQPQNIETLTRQVYTDIPEKMLPAAARNVFAHLIDFWERKLVSASPELSQTAMFALI